MKSLFPCLVAVMLLHCAWSAPVQNVDVDKRRESTKETIELEETLKRLAGEDKKYFSSSLAMPMPQVDGLQTDGEGSGEEQEEEGPPQPVLQDIPDAPESSDEPEDPEEQLMELPELEQSEKSYPVPGPYGPGLQTDGGIEYEPSEPIEEEDEEDEEGHEEDDYYYVARVMKTLRKHPELLSELIQDEESAENENAVEDGPENRIQPADLEDYDDQMEEIQAELENMRAQEQYQQYLAQEQRQQYLGDREAHVVSKKGMTIPKQHVEDNIESLNNYFEKYSGEDRHADVPIM